MDINLGENEEDGISLAKKINEEFPIPFIFLTAYDNRDIIKKGIETHPQSYITKTLKTIDLINSIEIALAKNTQKPKEKPYIVVRDGEYLAKLPLDEIYYIESSGNYLHI